MALNYREIVRKLMAQAAAETEAGNEAGAQTFAEKAAALATKHGIEAALDDIHTSEGPAKIVLKKVTLANPYPKHRISLLSVIAKHQNCKVLKVGRNGAELFGTEADVENVMFLYRLISTHMLNAVAQARPEKSTYGKHWYFKNDGLTPAEVKSFRVSWVIGYISGIAARMAEAYRKTVEQAKSTTPGAALVLADRRSLVEKHITETYPKLGRVTPSRISNVRAYQAGRAASTGADLGQTRVGNRRREISA